MIDDEASSARDIAGAFAKVVPIGPQARRAPDPAAAEAGVRDPLGRQLQAMAALLLFNEGVGGDRPFEEQLERLTAQLPEILDAKQVALVVTDAEDGRMSLYWCDASRAGATAERHGLEAVPLEPLRGGGAPQAWLDLLGRLPAHVSAALTRAPAARLKVTPVGHRDRLHGLLIACVRGRAASRPAGWAWHQVVARNVATAAHRVQRNRELVRRAYFDPLTGLPNRALFHDRLQQTVARARRTGRRLAVFYLDLDDFKWINDTLGHHAGDELLRRVAGLLASALRETDTVARLAGDEFAIVLPDVGDARQVDTVLATLRSRLQVPVELGDAGTFELRASIGVAVFPLHGMDADTLLRSADEAMYRVKRARTTRGTPAPRVDAPHAQASPPDPRDAVAGSGALL